METKRTTPKDIDAYIAGFPPEIRAILARQKKLEKLMPRGRSFATAAAATSLEQAAPREELSVTKSSDFTRVSGAEGIGRLNEAIGAAFSLPLGAVSAPIRTHEAIFVERVERRIVADSASWVKQKEAQRAQVLNQMRQQRVREFLTNLRASAKIVDRRKEIEAANRQVSE